MNRYSQLLTTLLCALIPYIAFGQHTLSPAPIQTYYSTFWNSDVFVSAIPRFALGHQWGLLFDSPDGGRTGNHSVYASELSVKSTQCLLRSVVSTNFLLFTPMFPVFFTTLNPDTTVPNFETPFSRGML